MQIHSVLAIALLAALAACSTPPRAPAAPTPMAAGPEPVASPTTPEAQSAAAPSAPPSALASEQRRLAELFRGTPVLFTLQADGSLRVDVPLRFCFDPKAAVVKPALLAVLDRVATSQRNTASRITLTAPGDPGDAAPRLATLRATSIRSRLVGRGIPIPRMTVKPDAGVDSVRLLIVDSAPQ